MNNPTLRNQQYVLNSISVRSRALEASKIRQVAEIGMNDKDVIPLWFGEGAWQTNPIIIEAAIASLRSGNHFYQPNNGASTLRQEICDYTWRIFDVSIVPEEVTVTASGMLGLSLVAQTLITPGDRVVCFEPAWPSIAGAFHATGAVIETVNIMASNGRWSLDMDAVLNSLTQDTTAVVVNSPNNPTGWTITSKEQQILLKHCRKHGIWVVSDDVYVRLYRHGRLAPSFLSIAEPDDLIVSVNSFSKAWSMTG